MVENNSKEKSKFVIIQQNCPISYCQPYVLKIISLLCKNKWDISKSGFPEFFEALHFIHYFFVLPSTTVINSKLLILQHWEETLITIIFNNFV